VSSPVSVPIKLPVSEWAKLAGVLVVHGLTMTALGVRYIEGIRSDVRVVGTEVSAVKGRIDTVERIVLRGQP
jgi:hypothetical protein